MAFGWRDYVPAAERRQIAEQAVARMKRGGVNVQPIRIEGNAIARTFWGKAWCRHLESYSDFENRLPRGRTYVRNGSVCHLEVLRGRVNASVQGSRMYEVRIEITPLPKAAWKSIKERCTGRIASLLDLLQGRLSAGVMEVVTDREKGLFPSPKEIKMECSCPDWATMCKHVAAVLYGVGARLDDGPELLFVLRGVETAELIGAHAEAAVKDVVLRGGKGRRIAEKDLASIFGMDIDLGAESAPAPKRKGRRTPKPDSPAASPFPAVLQAADIHALRKRLDLTVAEFARLLDVSAAAISAWERSRGPLGLQMRTRAAVQSAWTRGSLR
jgi:uncharacterized Zn finger protein